VRGESLDPADRLVPPGLLDALAVREPLDREVHPVLLERLAGQDLQGR
jgi:hypothetical protein